MQVFESLGSAKARLGFRVANSFECIHNGQLSEQCQTYGNFFRLIELSLSQSKPVERHGDDDSMVEIRLKPNVIERDFEKPCQFFGEVDLLVIFKIVNQIPPPTITVKRSAGKFEIEFEAMAIRTDKFIGNVTVITFATARAKWGFNIMQRERARVTEMTPLLQ